MRLFRSFLKIFQICGDISNLSVGLTKIKAAPGGVRLGERFPVKPGYSI
jgi:hypothetical protein